MISQGKRVVSGDVVEYVICEDGTTTAPTQRAYHPSEINDKSGAFELHNIDINVEVCHSKQYKVVAIIFQVILLTVSFFSQHCHFFTVLINLYSY